MKSWTETYWEQIQQLKYIKKWFKNQKKMKLNYQKTN